MRRALRSGGLAVVLVAIWASGADAATFVVDRFDDPAGPGACTAAPNDCSLNQAIRSANAKTDADVVQVPAGEFGFEVESIEPAVFGESVPVTIIGAGARQTVIAPKGELGFVIDTPGAVEVRDLKVTGAGSGGPAFGGAVFIEEGGDVTLRRVALVGNHTSGDPQFGIQHYYGSGAAVRAGSGNLLIEESLIAENKSLSGATGLAALGGAIALFNPSTVIRNSTISDNLVAANSTTDGLGGGIYLYEGTLKLDGVTLAGNSASGGTNPETGETTSGGNLWRSSTSVVRARDSIFALGSAPRGVDCNLPVTSEGGNVEEGRDCGLGAGDRVGVNPLLGPLADNGGPTDTRALGAGSPAINVAGACGLPVDQRGVARSDGLCDAGAFESPLGVIPPEVGPKPLPLVPPTAPPVPKCSLLASGNTAGLRVTAACDIAVTVNLGGTATIYPPATHGKAHGAKKKRPRPRTIALRGVTRTLTSGKLTVVRLSIPKSVVQAVRHHRRVSLKLTLTARTAAGAKSSATRSISKLTPARPKKKR
jgi:hypothetical protein